MFVKRFHVNLCVTKDVEKKLHPSSYMCSCTHAFKYYKLGFSLSKKKITRKYVFIVYTAITKISIISRIC